MDGKWDYWTETGSHKKNVEFFERMANKDEKRVERYLKSRKKGDPIDLSMSQRKFWKVSDGCYETNEQGEHIKLATYRGRLLNAKSYRIPVNFTAYSNGTVTAYRISDGSEILSRKSADIFSARIVYDTVSRILKASS